MSVIIRLQNLPWSASSVDIRKFFDGLSIPEGGVHIVGGELGDAFIAFSTDEDARQAFERNNRPLKQVQIKLALSSRQEMQKVIEEARTKPFLQAVPASAVPSLTNIMQKIPIAPQAPVITSTSSQQQKDKSSSPKRNDEKDSRSRGREQDDSRSRDRDDSRNRRDRNKRRSKSRSRSRERRDRSRDRRDRDRRRKDRSRSKDRRDNRRRDRRDRSKSRDRDKSRERDNRRSNDKNNGRRKSDKSEVIEIKDDPPNSTPRVWDQMNDPKMSPTGILGNFPAGNLDLLSNQQKNITNFSQLNMRFPRNDMMNRPDNNSWQRKSRFQQDENNMGQLMSNNNPLLRPNMPSNSFNMMGNMMSLADTRPNMFSPMNQPNLRNMFNQNQDNNFMNMNRPFLSRPGGFSDNFNRSQQDHMPFMQFGKGNDDYGIKQEIDGYCVQVRPYFGSYSELKKFFTGLFINNTGVKFVMNELGKRTGIAYVRFVHSHSKQQALERTGLMLRGVPVEVKHIDDDEWERCGEEKGDDNASVSEDQSEIRTMDIDNIQNSPVQHNNSKTCLVVNDLPEFVKEHDILKMFSEYDIQTVMIVINKEFQHSAYVQFRKEDEATRARKNKTSHAINGKPVTVRTITLDRFNEVQRQQANGELVDSKYDTNGSLSPHDTDQFLSNGPGSNLHNKIISDCVYLKGLPPKTSDRDVLDFFSDIGIVPTKIHIMHNQFGIHSGDAYCEFKTTNDAACALDKDDMPLGTGTVHVELVYRRDMDRALGAPTAPPLMNQNIPVGLPRFPNRFGPRGPNMLNPRGPPGMNMMRRRPPGNNPNMRFDGPDLMGPPGCTVSMENVPFKAGVNEILEFFRDFELDQTSVLRRFNENGAPTGDARVTFNSPEEAHRAVDECNRLKIRDRTIFLRTL